MIYIFKYFIYDKILNWIGKFSACDFSIFNGIPITEEGKGGVPICKYDIDFLVKVWITFFVSVIWEEAK